MNDVLLAEGAPVDQGRAQGRAHAAAIADELRRIRQGHGLLSWRRAHRTAVRTALRSLATQLPQQNERLEGVADGAGVRARDLALAESAWRISGAGFHSGTQLQACLELPPELAPQLALRESRPDAGGFASVELTCGLFAGCLAGVNSRGLAGVCLEDRGRAEPSLRFLAQELVYRASQIDAGVDHLRRRARYLGGSGLLLIGDAEGRARWLRLEHGEASVAPAPERELLAREPQLRIDAAARSLVYTDPAGREHEARLEASPDA